MMVAVDEHCAVVAAFVCLLACGCGRSETVVGIEAINSSPVTVDATVPVPPDARRPEPPDATDASGDEDTGPDDAAPDDASDSNPMDASVACAVPGDGSACVDTLSNIGAGDFHIRLEITTTETGLIALVDQRAICTLGMYWDLRAYPDHLVFETDDGLQGTAHYTHFDVVNTHVNDGQPHCLIAQRVGRSVTVFVDGVPSVSVPSLSVFGQLPPLLRGRDPCEGTDAGHDGTKPFVGVMTNLCITTP
jgi:hypothetical protein